MKELEDFIEDLCYSNWLMGLLMDWLWCFIMNLNNLCLRETCRIWWAVDWGMLLLLLLLILLMLLRLEDRYRWVTLMYLIIRMGWIVSNRFWEMKGWDTCLMGLLLGLGGWHLDVLLPWLVMNFCINSFLRNNNFNSDFDFFIFIILI